MGWWNDLTGGLPRWWRRLVVIELPVPDFAALLKEELR